jgi:hypothetical protein
MLESKMPAIWMIGTPSNKLLAGRVAMSDKKSALFTELRHRGGNQREAPIAQPP